MSEPTRYELELAEALRERLRIIADHAWRDRDPDGHLNALRIVSERLAELHRVLPPDASSHLRHYLQQSSYQKALALLEEQTRLG